MCLTLSLRRRYVSRVSCRAARRTRGHSCQERQAQPPRCHLTNSPTTASSFVSAPSTCITSPPCFDPCSLHVSSRIPNGLYLLPHQPTDRMKSVSMTQTKTKDCTHVLCERDRDKVRLRTGSRASLAMLHGHSMTELPANSGKNGRDWSIETADHRIIPLADTNQWTKCLLTANHTRPGSFNQSRCGTHLEQHSV
jgi:hypothetical protein